MKNTRTNVSAGPRNLLDDKKTVQITLFENADKQAVMKKNRLRVNRCIRAEVYERICRTRSRIHDGQTGPNGATVFEPVPSTTECFFPIYLFFPVFSALILTRVCAPAKRPTCGRYTITCVIGHRPTGRAERR